ncbi:hypothetical protein ACU686_23655 [Yinghuangia aomiensis]
MAASGASPHGEDEFRVVFDESFVRAAVHPRADGAGADTHQERTPAPARWIFDVPAGTFRVVAVAVVVVLVMTGALVLRRAARASDVGADVVAVPAVLIRVSLVPGKASRCRAARTAPIRSPAPPPRPGTTGAPGHAARSGGDGALQCPAGPRNVRTRP